MERRAIAMTIAGSDSGGGAGIQADLKTFHAFGVFGTTAITAVTAQNTVGVRSVRKIEPEIVADQIRAVAEDLRPAATKTGMLADAAIIEAVASAIRETGINRLVIDPVMVAKSGHRLLEDGAVSSLVGSLLPLADIVTPNLPEASILAGRAIENADDMRSAAETILQLGANAVVLKGGHLAGGEVIDLYVDREGEREWREPRVETAHTHGTGCTLSAAICAGLALGKSRSEAVETGRKFTRLAIETAPGLGAGHGPLNHWASVGD